MKTILKALLLSLLASSSLISCGGGGGTADVSISDSGDHFVLRWNQIAIDTSGIDHEVGPDGDQTVTASSQLGPTRSSRAMAIVHMAMFETLNAITPTYESYIGLERIQAFNPTEIVPEIALAKAARDSLAHLYPFQIPRFDTFLNQEISFLDGLSSDALDSSLELGENVARLIIELRANDNASLSTDENESLYEFSPFPGRWRVDPFNPNQIPLGSLWSQVTPFVMSSSAQFRAPPPPPINSQKYAEDYAEVYRIGGDGIQTPTERTAEETQIGIFWAYDGTPSLCAPPRLFNQLTRAIIKKHGPEGQLETARLLAMVNIAMADAAISIWEAKYFYDFWRPVTAIQESDPGTGPTGLGDSNVLTLGDPNFKPLGSPASNLYENNFTPPFPTYPSGHAGFGGALFQTLRTYYGRDDLGFSFVSDEFNGVTTDNMGNVRPVVERSFSNFSEAEEENGKSRVYIGVHFDFDKTSAIEQGRKIGDLVGRNLYRPLNQ